MTGREQKHECLTRITVCCSLYGTLLPLYEGIIIPILSDSMYSTRKQHKISMLVCQVLLYVQRYYLRLRICISIRYYQQKYAHGVRFLFGCWNCSFRVVLSEVSFLTSFSQKILHTQSFYIASRRLKMWNQVCRN